MTQTLYIVNQLPSANENLRGGDIYVLRNTGEIWQVNFENQLGGFFSFLGKIAGVAAPIANFIPGVGQYVSAGLRGLSSLSGGGGGGGVAKGLQGITTFGNEVINAFGQLLSQAANGQITKEEAYQKADKLVSLLSDGSVVYQAQKGKDAEALNNFKAQAKQKADEVKAAADNFYQRQMQQQQQPQMQGAILTGYTPQGQPIYQYGGGGGGIDTTTLLLFGGGALILVLLLR